jgi:hypothetical protein
MTEREGEVRLVQDTKPPACRHCQQFWNRITNANGVSQNHGEASVVVESKEGEVNKLSLIMPKTKVATVEEDKPAPPTLPAPASVGVPDDVISALLQNVLSLAGGRLAQFGLHTEPSGKKLTDIVADLKEANELQADAIRQLEAWSNEFYGTPIEPAEGE